MDQGVQEIIGFKFEAEEGKRIMLYLFFSGGHKLLQVDPTTAYVMTAELLSACAEAKFMRRVEQRADDTQQLREAIG